MSDTPRTDDIWYDPSRKYNGQLASSLYDLCRDLERENTVLCEKWRMAEDQCFDQVGKIGDLERENAALRAAIAESEEFARKNGETCSSKIRDLLRENARLQMEVDASCSAEELRQVRDENAQLHTALDSYYNGEQLRLLRDCVDRTGQANDRLVVENAALRDALNEFKNIAFIGMVAPVPDVRPYYSFVKKHEALLKNKLDREVKP